MNEKTVTSASAAPTSGTTRASGSNGADNPFDRVRQAPGDPGCWDAADETARSADSPDATEALYNEILASDDLSVADRRLVGQRAVEFLEEWYEDTTKSIQVLMACIEKDPGNAWALEKLSLLLTLAERWDDLLGTYDRALESVTEGTPRIHLLEEAARIAKDFAGQANRASDYLKALLLLRPSDTGLATSLERRLEQQERFADLVDVWRARLDVVSPEEAIELRLQIAKTLLEPLGQAPASLEEAKTLLAKGQAEAPTCTLMERLATLDATPLETKRAALELLENKFSNDDRIEDTIRVLRLSLAIADDVPLKCELYDKLVTWLELAESPELAQASAGEWLRVSPADESALKKLTELAGQTSDFRGLAEALVRASEGSNDAQVKVQLQLRAARVFREQADIPHSATELYARVLLDPQTRPNERLLAARQLRELLVSPAQYGQRLDVLEKLSVLEPEVPAQSEVLQEAAQLSERLGDDDRALRLWNECLERDVADKLALDSRIAILLRCERWPPLLEAYRARTAHPKDEVECRADWVAIAEIYDQRLADPGRAIDTWRHIEDTFERNAQTVDSLYELCCRTERWSEAASLLQSASATTKDEVRCTELLARLGDVLRVNLERPDAALAEYAKGLELLPHSERCRQGVISLLVTDLVREPAAEVLAKAYRTCEQWQEILDMLETRLEAAHDNAAKQAILTEAARISEEQLEQPAEALMHIQRAFAISPTVELESELLRLANDTGDWQSAVVGYQRALLQSADAERTIELLSEQGRLQEEKLRDWSAALSSYRRVVELDHAHLEGAQSVIRTAGHIHHWHDASWALIESAKSQGEVHAELVFAWTSICREMNAWTEALAELEATLRDTRDTAPKTSHDVKFQLAIWQYRERQAADLAESLLKEAVAEHRAVASLELLVELQRVAPSRDLVTSLLQLSALLDDPLPQLDEAAHVALEVVGDATLAKPILARALATAEAQLAEAPRSHIAKIAAWCVDRLVEIAIAAGDYQEAFEQLTHAATIPFESELLWSLKHRAAVIATTNLGQHETAIAACEDVLGEAPDRLETVNLLTQLYEAQGKLAPLSALLRQELQRERPLELRLHARLELARVLGMQSPDASERVECLMENLAETPGHESTIDALGAVLMSAKRARDLYTVLCDQADLVNQSGDGVRASELYARAGHLARTDLADDDKGLEALRSSVALSPTCPVLDSLADIHTLRSEFAEAVLWLEQRLQLTSTDDTDARRLTLVRLGEALHAAGRVEDAVNVLDQGLERDPAAHAVRALLVSLQESRQAWPELAALLAEGVPFLENPPEKVDYLSRAAQVRWRELGDIAGAVPLLRQAVKLAPEDRQLRLWLGEASRLAGLLPEARDLLTALLEEFGRRRTPERARVHFQVALIDRAEGKLDAALEHLDAASNIARGDALILRTLGDVAREKGELERAETAYRALLLLVGRGPVAPTAGISVDGSEPSPEGESAILYELYKIAKEKQDQDRARDLLDSALEKSEHPAEAAVLEQTLREAGEWELLHQALQRRQARISTKEEERALTADRADVLTHLGRVDEALNLRLNLVALDPTDAKALEGAAKLAEATGAQERFRLAVVELAEKLAEDRPEVSCQLWLRLGRDAESRDDTNSAANFYERAQITGAEPEATFEALHRIHEQTGDIHGLTLALQRFVESAKEGASGANITDAMYRLAEIELCSAAGRDSGAERLAKALALDAQPERAIAILTTAVEVVAPTETMLTQLEQLARDSGDREALALALYHRGIGPSPDLPRLEEAVKLFTGQGDVEKLGLLLRRTVDVARESDQLEDVVWALVQLADLKLESEQYRDAERLLGDAIDASPKKKRLELQLRLGELLDQKMGEPARAAELYEGIAQTSPGDARAWKPLVAIYRRSNDVERLQACLSRAEEHAPGEDERRALRLERLRLMVDAGQLEEAEVALRASIDEGTAGREATDLLIDLLEKQSRTQEMQSLLTQALSDAIDAGEDTAIVRYALRLGQIHEAASETEEALQVYREAQSAVRNNRDLINAVLRLLPGSEDHERANLLESLIPAERSDKVGHLAAELADLRSRLGDEAGEERAMELGFRADPTNAFLRDRLEAWYRERDHWGPLVDLLVLDASHRSVASEAIARYLEAAGIYDQKLYDAFAAGDVLLKALDLDPTSLAILEPLTQHLTTSGRAEQAALALTTAIESPELPEQDLPVLHYLRAVARGRLDQNSLRVTQEAISDLDLAIARGRPDCDEQLAELLERQRYLGSNRGEKQSERGAVLRLAELLPTLNRPQDAIVNLALWVESNPKDKDAVLRYAELAYQLQDWDAAATASLKLFELSQPGEEKIVAGLKFAEAHERLGTPLQARGVLEQLYAESPQDERVGRQLRMAYEAAGAHHELASMLLHNAAKTNDLERRYRFLLDAGELLVATGEPHPEAVRALEEALRIRAGDHKATLGLARALTLHGDIEGACGILGEAIKAHGKRRSAELAELQYGMAQVAQIAEDDEGRFAWLDAALQSDRKNGVVASELALFAIEREDYDNALKALQLVTLLKEDCPMSRAEAYLRQGQISALRGDTRKAALLAKRALTADPDYGLAREFLEHLGVPR